MKKAIKQFLAMFTAAAVAVGTFASAAVPGMAATETVTEEDKVMGDSLKSGIRLFASSSTPSAPDGTVATGVDISYHNGTIDFEVLAEDVDFVVIRCGYGSDYTSQDDKNFETYVKGCVEYDIPFGVYLYSYATTTAKATSEAAHTTRLLDQLEGWGAEMSLPVFYDMEDSSMSSLSASAKASIAKTYCTAVEAEGYETGIYASKSWWTSYLTDSYFDDVTKWVAQYSSRCTYTGSYSMWQCSSSASVDGISGNVDLNYMLEDIFIGEDYETVYNGVDYSAVYDYNYYIGNYADLKKAYGNDSKGALQHFVTYGMKEGRQAKETFDVTSYRNKYQDLRKAFRNDLPSYYLHYIEYGEKEGRIATGVTSLQNPLTTLNGVNYSAVYDYSYFTSNSGSAYAGDDIGALEYFVNTGMSKKLQGSSSFDVTSYFNKYRDLRKAYGKNWTSYYMHYINYGKKEGRVATGVTEMQDAVTTLNGVNYSAVYDYNYYINKYSDLKKAFDCDEEALLQHFVTYGMKEGRQAKSTFNVTVYKNRYADLRKAFGSDLKQYYLHYINYGQKEGRTAV